MAEPNAADRKRILGFDGLRAISALLVFCEHKLTRYTVGLLGVWIFFTLSGYLICGILHDAALAPQPASHGRWRALLEFWRHRALRIFPIYYLTLAVLFAITPLVGAKELVIYSAYLQNFYIAFVSHSWTPITHFWSLAIEQQFYVCVAPLLLWLAPERHRLGIGWLFGVCLAAVVACEIFAWDPMAVSLLPTTNFAFIALGGLLRLSPSGASLRLKLASPAAFVLSGLGLATSFVVLSHPENPESGTPFLVFLFGLIFCGALVARVVESQDSLGVRILEKWPLTALGRISYGFYIYHALLPNQAQVLSALFGAEAHVGVPKLLWAALELTVSILLASASWVWIERPFLALKRPLPVRSASA